MHDNLIIPKILGLVFRTHKDESDLPKMVSVRERSKEHDKVDEFSTLESVPSVQELAESVGEDNCVPQKDIVIVEMSGEVIGYSKLGWWTENDGTWLYLHLGYLVPKWRGRGIGTAMLHWSQDRIREIAKNHPTNGKGMLGSNATNTEIEKTQLLLGDGYKKVFTMVEMDFDMSQELQDTVLAKGFELRPVKSEDIRMIWEANNKVYANRDFVTPPTEEDFKDFVENPNNDFSLWHVAWYGDEVAAFVLSEIKDGKAELTEVSTVEKYRRKGLAQTLLTKNLIALRERDVKVIRLHTSGENVEGARTLYEKVGFKHLKDHIRYRKPL